MGWPTDWLKDWWNKDDPLHQVDPNLREFLVNEAPQTYRPASGSEPEPETYRQRLGLVGHNDPEAKKTEKEPSKPDNNQPPPEKPLPSESLFQDGRYKHLWATYRPLAEIEQAVKSDQEKLKDIVRAFKDRQAEVKDVAMENCADEQFNMHDCFRNGKWSSKMTMCRDETKSFNKCVLMQSKFLRALGYASLYDRPPAESENIQMHADRLYHRMLDQERLIAEAKEKNEPVPPLPPLMEFERDASSTGLPVHSKAPEIFTFETLPKDVQEKLAQERFAGLDGPRLELAKRELEEHIALNQDMVRRINENWIQDRKSRLKRLARGEEWFSDKIKRWFDMREYPDDD